MDGNKTGLPEPDLLSNKNTRIPVCIMVDTSDRVIKDRMVMDNIREGVKRFISFVNEDIVLRSMIDLSCICFGSETKVTREYSLIRDNDINVDYVEEIKGAPDFSEALRIMKRRLEIRISDYTCLHRMYQKPFIIILGSGETNDKEDTDTFETIKHLDASNQVNILPVVLNDTHEESVYRSITSDGTLCKDDLSEVLTNIKESLDSRAKSIESAFGSFQDAAYKPWEEFRRKR